MSSSFVVTYRVSHLPVELTASAFAEMLRELVSADADSQVLAKSPADDDIHVESYEAVGGPSGTSPVSYSIRHRASSAQEPISRERLDAHLRDVLDIPQRESGPFSVRDISVRAD